MKRLYESVQSLRDMRIYRKSDLLDSDSGLIEEGFDPSLAVPLYEGDVRLGAMFLLGLPDEQHLASLITLLDHLAPAVSLVLRNASFYEEQEKVIEDRTAKLWEVNRRLQIELAERRRAEQSLRERERDVASLLEVSEDSRRALLGILEDEKRAEAELARYRDHLEELVGERTRELAKSREQLQRAERLASIGTLAAGIAHEINNPLGMMLLGADLALRSLDDPEKLAELLRQQKRDLERCARIVKGVLNFARHRPMARSPIHLNEVVGHSIDFTREYTRLHGVAIEARLSDSIAPIMGNATELEQVVVNLVHNAVQACGDGGHVTIEAHEAGDKVRLVIRDDGCGMTPEQIEHAFDPFYTTRVEKGGTGLGLSTVHGIVTGVGGTIEISSEPGRGAVFTMDFPSYTCADAGQNEGGSPSALAAGASDPEKQAPGSAEPKGPICGVDMPCAIGLESPPVNPLPAMEPAAADRA